MTRDELMPALVEYTHAIHQALETESDHLNRPRYLGHLAMAARIFMYLHLEGSREKLEQILRLENRSHAQTLPGAVAVTTRDAWRLLVPKLAAYIEQA